MEKYVQDLLLTEKAKDLNIYPIEKAKRSLQLGRGVPLIAADGSKIRLNPKPKDMFYRFSYHEAMNFLPFLLTQN